MGTDGRTETERKSRGQTKVDRERESETDRDRERCEWDRRSDRQRERDARMHKRTETDRQTEVRTEQYITDWTEEIREECIRNEHGIRGNWKSRAINAASQDTNIIRHERQRRK